MNKIILKKTNIGNYWPRSIEGYEEYILEHFLTTDVGLDSKGWIEWVNNSEQSYTSSNATFISKGENDIIELYDVLDEEVNLDISPCFMLKKSKLIELLQTWEKLNLEKPNFIVITVDGDKITMEGKENDLL